jgi:hypothetical protein
MFGKKRSGSPYSSPQAGQNLALNLAFLVSPNRVILDVAKGSFTLAKIGAKTHATATEKVLTLATLGDATHIRIGPIFCSIIPR